MPLQKLVGKLEIAEILNRDVAEIEDLMDRKEIPFLEGVDIVDSNGQKGFLAFAFPVDEVLGKITPRKKKASKPK